MRKFSYGLLALVAAAIPMLPASAQSFYSNLYNPYLGYNTYASPTYSSTYTYTNPYRYRVNTFGAVYPYYSEYQAKQAAANTLINQVNSAIQAGQITVEQGNAILVRGSW